MTYKAFLSYSHAADGKLAPAVQSALHRFAKPWYRLRAMRVFRDKTSLAMTPALWPSIEAALQQSEHFLLLASPRSAQSEWVQKEVGWWLERRNPQTLLLLLTDGELDWDNAGGDFNWTKTTALPVALKGCYRDEPLWVDLRWAKRAGDLSLRHSQFRGAILDIAAPLLGRPKDELDGEDVRQHRRTKVVASAAVLAIALFAIVAAWQAYVAQQRYLTALSRQLAAEALIQLADAPDRALLLAVAASTVRDTVEARSSLLTALESSPLMVLQNSAGSAAQSVAFGPDGRLITGHDNGEVALWRLDAPARPALRVRAPNPVRVVAFSPDGQTIAAADSAGLIALWATDGGEEPSRRLHEHEFPINGLAFSRDGKWLASIDTNAFAIVRSPNHADSPKQKELEGALLSMDVDPSTSMVAVGSDRGALWLWRPDTDAVSTFKADESAIRSVAFSPRGILATGSDRGVIKLWNVESTPRLLLRSSTEATGFRALAFSPDGQRLAVAQGRSVALWDSATLRQVGVPLTGHGDLVFTVAFSRDGRTLASGDSSGRILLWDLEGHRPLQRHAGEIWSLAVSDDGRFVATGSEDRTIRLTELPSRKTSLLAGVHRDGVSAVTFLNPEGSRLVSAGNDNVIADWPDAPDGTPRIVTSQGSHFLVTSIGENDAVVAAGTDGRLARLDLATGRSAPFDRGHDADVNRLVASRTGRLIASLDRDGNVFVWDAPARRWLRELPWPQMLAATSLVFAPDGGALAVGYDDGAIWLWDTGSWRGELLARAAGDVKALAISADGAWLASGDEHGGIRLWDLSLRQQVGPELKGHRDIVTGLAFQPRASPSWLVSASDDSTALLWDLDVDSWRRRACRRANRDLQSTELRQYLAGYGSLTVCASR